MVFLKYHNKEDGKDKAWFDLSTVPFPNPIKVPNNSSDLRQNAKGGPVYFSSKCGSKRTQWTEETIVWRSKNAYLIAAYCLVSNQCAYAVKF